jgi:excinuclease ABC subunit A
LLQGAIAPWAKSKSPYFVQTIEALSNHYKFDRKKKWKDLPEEFTNCSYMARKGQRFRSAMTKAAGSIRSPARLKA